jgi:hypothetical protein
MGFSPIVLIQAKGERESGTFLRTRPLVQVGAPVLENTAIVFNEI